LELNLKRDLRRLENRLPAGWQLRIDDVNRFIQNRYDWARPIKSLRELEQSYLEETALRNQQKPNRKRVLVCSLQNFPPWLEVDYVLAMALKLRGHEVRGILCDGILPICERNLGVQERPSCAGCIAWLGRYEDAFGFSYGRLSDFLSKMDLKRAEDLVAQTPIKDLPAMGVDGIHVGRLALAELQRYYRGFVFDPTSGESLPVYKKWLVSGVLLTWLYERVLEDIHPDIVITSAGRTLLSASILHLARQRGISVVTWDTSPYQPNGLKFSHNRAAVEVCLEDVWPDASKQSLTADQVKELYDYARRWSRSEITPFPYNPSPLENEQIIRQQLGLRANLPIIVAFTNTSWDMSAVDRDIGFKSMYDWVFSLVEYAIKHPEIDLIVRAHPVEKKAPPGMQSRTLVVPEIKKRYELLPNNIKLIEGDSPISSYTLGEIGNVIMLYSGMIGLEFALRGYRPWVAGEFTYRGKGFTLDLESKEHMFQMLDKHSFAKHLSEDELKLAQRFAYLWIFRHLVRNPFVRMPDDQFMLESFHELAPAGTPVIDDICENIITGKPFIDIGKFNPSRKM
jgi:hypothetical protein